MTTVPKWKRPKDPSKTKTGKIRLGVLNLQQLKSLLEKTSTPKEKHRIRARIVWVEKRSGGSSEAERLASNQ
jgi:hypothetical protein